MDDHFYADNSVDAGAVSSYAISGFIPVLIVIAIVLGLIKVIQGRRPCSR